MVPALLKVFSNSSLLLIVTLCFIPLAPCLGAKPTDNNRVLMKLEFNYTAERSVNPNELTQQCIGLRWYHTHLATDNCRNRLFNTSFTPTNTTVDQEKLWKLVADVSVSDYWYKVIIIVGPEASFLTKVLKRSGPYRITPVDTGLIAGKAQLFEVEHKDAYWETLTFHCDCEINAVNCSHFVICPPVSPTYSSHLDPSQCSITPPYGETSMLCEFIYQTNGTESKALYHTFAYSGANPQSLIKISQGITVDEFIFLMQVILEGKNNSLQTHINVSLYTGDGIFWSNVAPRLYSLRNYQIGNSSEYNITFNISSPYFNHGSEYKLRITTLSCFSDCSAGNSTLVSSDYLELLFSTDEKPFSPVEIQHQVFKRYAQLRLQVSWTVSYIILPGSIRVVLCKGMSHCENVYSSDTVYYGKNSAVENLDTSTWFVVQPGYYYVQVIPMVGKTLGDGKSMNITIAPEKPHNLTLDVIYHRHGHSIIAKWKMDILLTSNIFAIRLCSGDDTTRCFYQHNVTKATRDKYQFSFTWNLNKTLPDGVYLLILQAQFDSLVSAEAKQQFDVDDHEQGKGEAKNNLPTTLTLVFSIVACFIAAIAAIIYRAKLRHLLNKIAPRQHKEQVKETESKPLSKNSEDL